MVCIGQKVLGSVEIDASRDFYDFEAKWKSGDAIPCATTIVVAGTGAVEAAGLAAHLALGCRGLTRSDVILGSNGRLFWKRHPARNDGEQSCSKGRAHAGISFNQLIQTILDLARYGENLDDSEPFSQPPVSVTAEATNGLAFWNGTSVGLLSVPALVCHGHRRPSWFTFGAWVAVQQSPYFMVREVSIRSIPHLDDQGVLHALDWMKKPISSLSMRLQPRVLWSIHGFLRRLLKRFTCRISIKLTERKQRPFW